MLQTEIHDLVVSLSKYLDPMTKKDHSFAKMFIVTSNTPFLSMKGLPSNICSLESGHFSQKTLDGTSSHLPLHVPLRLVSFHSLAEAIHEWRKFSLEGCSS